MGLGSFRSLNLALLSKWLWKLKVDLEHLWARIVTAIHKLGNDLNYCFAKASSSGVWSNIAKSFREMEKFGLTTPKVMKMANSNVRWITDFEEDGKLSVAILRTRLDRATHPIPDGEFTWSNAVPKKVVCFVWRAKQNRIPSMVALIKRGVPVNTITCDVCQVNDETTDQLLIESPLAKEVWSTVEQWCGLSNSFLECTTVQEVLAKDRRWRIDIAIALQLRGCYFLVVVLKVRASMLNMSC
ncbi:unnamed protein product [Lactuca saligna]|uniref:Reverse transcriptase zinc-binding domain-containing protein n=1 Tax=Lactuca saligna TaxID=75948 RepID=A0AA35ZE12_LACSI|nr:unnamed protein product [Lactuca saligna]